MKQNPVDAGNVTPRSIEPVAVRREIEIKFKADKACITQALSSRLLETGSATRGYNLRTVYFDTPSSDLLKSGIILRVRKIGRAAPILGVKMTREQDGPFSRMEVEVGTYHMRPELNLLGEELASEIARVAGDCELDVRFETRIKRHVILVESDRTAIEAAFDEGVIVTDQDTLPLTEIELELKSGEEAALYDLAIRLAEEHSLRLDFVSKSERGFRFSSAENAVPVKATPICFTPDASLDDVISILISSSLLHFVSNWASLRENDDAEAIHQMRVSLRRMRTALAMFKHALSCTEFDALRADANHIASALGPARECDVFIEAAQRGPLAHADQPTNHGVLLAAIKARRSLAYKEARALIEEVNTTIFVLKAHHFLARRAWRNALSGFELTILTGSATDFAAASLDRLRSRVLRRGKGLPTLTDLQRHELRIALKNLRYGSEFFASLFGHQNKTKAFTQKIAALQHLLGKYNDAAAAKQFLDSLETEANANAERAAAFILGWNACGGSILAEQTNIQWEKFKRSEPFWMSEGKG